MVGRFSALELSRGGSVLVVGLLTLVLLALLPAPGYRTSRLVLFALIIAIGWVGAAGAVLERFWLTLGAAIGLFLLGFWQFTIGVVMLPTSLALLLTAILIRGPSEETALVPT